jgi:hypothetical protein
VAADELGRQLYILKAGTESELDATFAGLVEQKIGGLVIGADSFRTSNGSHRSSPQGVALPAPHEKSENMRLL